MFLDPLTLEELFYWKLFGWVRKLANKVNSQCLSGPGRAAPIAHTVSPTPTPRCFDRVILGVGNGCSIFGSHSSVSSKQMGVLGQRLAVRYCCVSTHACTVPTHRARASISRKALDADQRVCTAWRHLHAKRRKDGDSQCCRQPDRINIM